MNTGSETSLVKNYAMLVSLMESYLILEYAEPFFQFQFPLHLLLNLEIFCNYISLTCIRL